MSLSRTLSLAASLFGTVVNLAFALRLNKVSSSLLWENESEWEGSPDIWLFGDSVKLIWTLLFAYFAVAAASCAIGFIGIVKVSRIDHMYSCPGVTPLPAAHPETYPTACAT